MGARALVVFHPPCEGNCPHFPSASDILTYRRMYPIYYDCNARVTTDIIPDDVLLFLFLASFLFFFLLLFLADCVRPSVYMIYACTRLSRFYNTHTVLFYTLLPPLLLLILHYYFITITTTSHAVLLPYQRDGRPARARYHE